MQPRTLASFVPICGRRFVVVDATALFDGYHIRAIGEEKLICKTSCRGMATVVLDALERMAELSQTDEGKHS